MTRRPLTRLLLLLLLLVAVGCATRSRNIPGTSIAESQANRDLIEVVERYRLAVEAKDSARLIAMASRNYWEDGGTPTGSDDYGYDGLRDMLTTRFHRVEKIRYSLRYVSIQRKARLAYVDVLIDASYSIPTTRGLERRDMKDQNRLVLEHDGQSWLFVSGM